jgi:hypothetical protein
LHEVADMGQFTTRLAEPAEPDRSKTLVTTPEDDEYDVTDSALATRLGVGCASSNRIAGCSTACRCR